MGKRTLIFWYASDSVVIHHESCTPGRGTHIPHNRMLFAERWSNTIKPDDASYYLHDGIDATAYKPDNTKLIEIGIASWAPRVLKTHAAAQDALVQHQCQIMSGAAESLRIAIKCPVPSESEAHAWGDYHFALSLQHALASMGYRVRVDLLPQWYSGRAIADDVVIVLRGLTAYQTSRDQINLCWLISRPERATDAELESYNHVFVASTSYAEQLRARLAVPVTTLLQCSDPLVFHPPINGEGIVHHDLLFVGNSRRQKRKIVQDCIDQGLPIAVHGREWTGLIPEAIVKSTHIPNVDLHRYYGSAKIVLNDHWTEMAKHGFVSNRIFDVGLSGGFVISDRFVGAELFNGAVVTYETPAELRELCDTWLADPENRKRAAQQLRAIVLADHTFRHRAAVLSEIIVKLRTCFETNPTPSAPAPVRERVMTSAKDIQT
jgi:hypothetical protein